MRERERERERAFSIEGILEYDSFNLSYYINTHVYRNKFRVWWYLLALKSPEGIVCLRVACNVYHERQCNVGRKRLLCCSNTCAQLYNNKEKVEVERAEGELKHVLFFCVFFLKFFNLIELRQLETSYEEEKKTQQCT